MDRLLKALKSRTIWSLVAMVIITGIPAIQDQIPDTIQPMVQLILALLAGYFKLNPSQTYK